MRTEWRKIADTEARKYREYAQYLHGYAAAQGAGDCPRHTHTKQAHAAITNISEYLRTHEPDMHEFAVRYYGWDESAQTPLFRRRESMQKWALARHISVSSLYKWREQILDLLALALCQAGILRVF